MIFRPVIAYHIYLKALITSLKIKGLVPIMLSGQPLFYRIVQFLFSASSEEKVTYQNIEEQYRQNISPQLKEDGNLYLSESSCIVTKQSLISNNQSCAFTIY